MDRTTPDSFSSKTGYNEVIMFLKSNGTQKWGKGFKETQRGI